ncbi:MAG: ComF family protein [Bacteroidia bacterium]
MWKYIRALLIDQSCYGCGNMLTSQEAHICLNCMAAMEETGFQFQPQNNELYYRMAGRLPLAGAASLYYFDKGGRLQRILKQLKYEEAPMLGQRLGQLLGERLAGSPLVADIDRVVPIPLHPRRQTSRGYNQGERIARSMAGVLDLPVDMGLVRRVRHTQTQARKQGVARWKNVDGAFLATGQPSGHVLLVDDVITTGATLVSCGQSLAAAAPSLRLSVVSVGMAR